MSADGRAPKILLLGAGGQLGRELARKLARTLEPGGMVVTLDRSALDVTDASRVRSTLRELRPEVVINAAAYTQVDRAEAEANRAIAVNAEAPGVLAEEAARLGALLVHFSTDYVFDGRKGAPYEEVDEPNPLNVYGATKLAGENAIRFAHDRHLILRTAWLYGLHGRNFLRTILGLARARDELRIVDDQVGSPTWSRWLAETTARTIDRAVDHNGLRGTYHVAGGGSTTWYGLARAAIAHRDDGDPPRKSHGRPCQLVPISTSEYPTPARRPSYSALSTGRFAAAFSEAIPPWEEQLRRCLTSP
ncbi:dTDP-4-dehydrorhamnose reductase [soil metagenome]